MADEVALFAARFNALGAEYMITGATAAILYGQPRVTNDIDVVVALRDGDVTRLTAAFPQAEFYLPPESVIRVERARRHRGHFNILHLESGYKADVYLTGEDPLHRWAWPLRRFIPWTVDVTLAVAPPEYVVLRKLEYYREGGSSKHPADIRAILRGTALDRDALERWIERLGLGAVWTEIVATER
ncbi:MAG: hypothetical protein QJR02_06640 [Sinobacteraceae bacterium]|nr:hypothetical protein [Nevskiaceae bacterium]